MPRLTPSNRPYSFTGAALLNVLATVACGTGTASREEPIDETVVEWVAPKRPPEGSPVDVHGKLSLDGTQIVDQGGNPIQLKGVSTQWLNFEGSFSSNAEAVVWMRDNWDITLLRGAMGVEETGGYIDGAENMTSRLERVIENAIDAGVYVIIDWHSHAAHEHQAEAESFFTQMSKKWGDYPHIIWETFNEPVHEVDWRTVLKPYHEATVASIRANDPDNLIVLGNPFWSQRPNAPLEGGTVGDAGTPSGAVEGTNLLYTLHFYACTHGEEVRANGQEALDAGLPVFVTEWGATTADGGILEQGGRLCEAEGAEWMDWMDENGISWAAWRLDACTDLSCLLKPGSPYSGDWAESDLNGHGSFVVANLKK
jgi:endoglucanase